MRDRPFMCLFVPPAIIFIPERQVGKNPVANLQFLPLRFDSGNRNISCIRSGPASLDPLSLPNPEFTERHGRIIDAPIGEALVNTSVSNNIVGLFRGSFAAAFICYGGYPKNRHIFSSGGKPTSPEPSHDCCRDFPSDVVIFPHRWLTKAKGDVAVCWRLPRPGDSPMFRYTYWTAYSRTWPNQSAASHAFPRLPESSTFGKPSGAGHKSMWRGH